MNSYKEAEPWSKFKEIVVLNGIIPDTSGFTSTVKEKANSHIYYYTIDGKRIDQPQRGINIIKMSDGSTKKVITKK